ncbi:MAG: hypothetical protein ACI8T1_002155 [Verrucomicrobiales bacterium]
MKPARTLFLLVLGCLVYGSYPVGFPKDARERIHLIRESKDLHQVLTYLVLYSGDHAGHYPNSLSELQDISEETRDSLLYWRSSEGVPIPIHYIAGLIDSGE